MNDEASKLSRHVEIMRSIEELQYNVNKLDILLNEIIGENTPEEQEKSPIELTAPPLAHVLDKGGSLISDQSEKINYLVNEIKNRLF